ncbi:AraC family transcriptional regulator, partial [Pseudomonas frederiksbergensis]|nr:AraC family transcriptional regulator [Pseudomonas frederiksbergensis]
VWVPPDTEHSCYNPQAIVYRSVYLDRELCQGLPDAPCTLVISEILKAILGDFAARDVKVAQDQADQRLAQVLVDQLRRAPTQTCYLPY